MIEVLSSYEVVTNPMDGSTSHSYRTCFTTVDGVQPYRHKYAIPVAKLEYADSVFNTLSHGINADWYTEGSDGTFVNCYSGVVPNVKFYSGAGVPETILGYHPGRRFKVWYHCEFKAPIDANYTFYMAGEGLGGINVAGYDSTDLNIGMNDKTYQSVGPIWINANDEETIYFRYISKVNSRDSGFIGLWQTDSASVTPEKIVMSGGVSRRAGVTLPTFSDIKYFSNISYKESQDGASELSFEVPFVDSSNAYTYGGYYYDDASDSYIELSSGNRIKKYRMIRYSEGYRNSSNEDEFATRFTGQIRDIKIVYSKEGEDKLKVTCYDYSVFTKDSINKMTPTPIDYWQVGYCSAIPGRANGETKPQSFDGWEIYRVYQILLTESGIDPYSFYNRKQFKNYLGQATSGGFLIEPINFDEVSFLPVKENYGISPIGEVDKNDDEYIYSIDTGEYYKDFIDSIMKSRYYKWGFSPDGYPYLKTINVPYKVIDDRDFTTSGTWTEQRNVNAIKGTYLECQAAGAIAMCTVTGKKFVLSMGCNSLGGGVVSGNAFNVKVRKGGTTLVNLNCNLYNIAEHFYYDGADQSTGLNESVIKIANGLPYDTYTILITHLNNSYKTWLDAVLCYDEEYEVPSDTYYTGDTITSGNIVQLDVSQNTDNHRNDCIVLGSRTGTIFKIDQEGKEVTINPNNPTYTYIQSSSRDLDSIYKSTAVNYVGHPRTTIIIDPSIASQNQADFISYNFISEYNTIKKEISFEMLGNPKIQPNDCIAVVDSYKAGVNASDYLWVTEVENNFSDIYTTRINTTPFKLVDSYWDRPSIDIENEYDGCYIWNLKVSYGGNKTTLSQYLSTTATQMFINETYSSDVSQMLIPPFGYCRIGKEIIRYSSADYNGTGIRLSGLLRGIPNGDSAWAHYQQVPGPLQVIWGEDVVIANNPYSIDAWSPTIEFDLLIDADVDVGIYNETVGRKNLDISSFLIDSLTNINENISDDNYRFLKAGHYKFSWGGFDRSGEYNDYLRLSNEPSFLGVQLYARENYPVLYVQKFDNYATNAYYSTGYGMFYGEVKVNPRIRNIKTYQTTKNDSYSYWGENNSVDRGSIKQILIDPGIIDLQFSTSGMFFASCLIASSFWHWENGEVEKSKYYTYKKNNRKTGSFPAANLHQATNYPTISTPSSTTKIPVWLYNYSNLNNFGESQGLLFTIKSYTQSIDSSIAYYYLPSMNFQFIQLGWYHQCSNQYGPAPRTMHYFSKVNEGNIADESDINILKADQQMYFNLKKWTANKNIEFIPKEWQTNFVTFNKDISNASEAEFHITNYLVFDDNIRDLSGRKPRQVRFWYQGIEANTDEPFTQEAFDDEFQTLQSLLTKNKTLPYYFKVIKDTATNWNRTNRGFYEFMTPESVEYKWKYINPNPIPGETHDPGTINWMKDHSRYVLFYKNLKYECMPRLNIIYRNNYITWVNENYVKEIIFYDTAFNHNYDEDSDDTSSHYLYKRLAEAYGMQNLFVPNIWFRFVLKDFP